MSLKKIFFIFCIFTMFSTIFAQEEKSQKYPQLDGDFRFYLPSLFGTVTGNNAIFERKDYESVNSCFNFMNEVRMSFFSLRKTTFSASFGMGWYSENAKNFSKDTSSMCLSLGLGSYFHFFEFQSFPLNGLCFYLYPAYQIPIYTWNFEPYLKWKMAFDLGYNFVFGNIFSVYPYMRNVFGWNSSDFRYGFDLGIAIGIYFHDRNYY